MNVRTLLDNFDLIADAPGGVPKLRELILQLAVQGRLTGQCATSADWRKLSMREACLLITDGEHATPQRTADGIPLATAKNVRDGFLDMENTDFVSSVTAQKCWRRCRPRHNDVLMVCVGATTGRVCRVQHPPDMVLVRSVALIRPNENCLAPSFLELFLRSPNGQSQIWGNVKQSAQPCLYLGRMGNFVISLPPLPEQQRIVAKVDELMKRCDELENRQKERSAHHKTLVTSCLNALSGPKCDPELIIQHSSFSILFSSAESISELRKTILQLAVQGRLVPTQVGRSSKSSEQGQLPASWEWKTIGELQPEFQNGLSKRVGQTGEKTPVVRLANIVNGVISATDVREIMMTSSERKKYELLPSDILITRVNGSVDLVGSFTQVAIIIDAAYCDHFIRMRLPADSIMPEYAVLYGKSELCREAVAKLFITTAGQKTVNQGHVSSLQVPLPPLAEQKRIVTKVNELMGMCDKLKTKLTQSSVVAEKLAGAVINHISA